MSSDRVFLAMPVAATLAGCDNQPQKNDPVQREVDTMRDFIASTYDQHITFGSATAEDQQLGIFGDALTTQEQRDILSIYMREIIKYPPDFYKKYMATRIFKILKNLHHDDNNYLGGQVFLDKNALYLSFMPYANGPEDILLPTQTVAYAALFHHELNHVRDYREGYFQPQNPTTIDQVVDKAWVSLNSRGLNAYKWRWQYDLFSQFLQAVQDTVSVPDGFASTYGMYNTNEDKATVAESMMTKYGELYNKAYDQANRLKRPVGPLPDPVLMGKIELTKARLLRDSNGLMDTRYWNDLEFGKITVVNYWNK